MRNARLYITDILAAITSIEEFVAGMSLADLRADDKTASAVIRKFEVIGEAAKNLPDEVKVATPDVPWREMAGMRDKLIHFYFGIDYPLVWRAITERLPGLKTRLRAILASLPKP